MPASPTLRLTGYISSAFLAFGLAHTSASQSAGPRTIYVSVVDGKGTPIPGLTPADFRLREDGKPRLVETAEVSRAPLSVALMLDDSGRAIQAIREGAARFVGRLQGVAETSITTTGGRNIRVLGPTSSTPQLVAAVNKVFARNQSGAYLVEGLAEAARDFTAREVTRPVIVSVANEGDEFSNLRAPDALAAIQRSGAHVYLVRLGTPVIGASNPVGMLRGESNADEATQANSVFAQAPARSGGSIDQLNSYVGIPGVMERIAIELLGQYAITYTSADLTARDLRLQIETTRAGAKVRAQTRVGGPR